MKKGNKIQKKDRSQTATILLIAIILIAVVINSSWQGIFSKMWDNGKWNRPHGLSFGPYQMVEYNGLMHAFYDKETVNTFNDNGTIEPGEYTLNDLFHTTYDGNEWRDEQQLTPSFDDNSTNFQKSVVFHNRLFVFYANWHLIDKNKYSNISSNWNLTIKLLIYDGTSWTVDPSNMAINFMDAFVFRDELWLLGGTGEVSHTLYWVYDGTKWNDRGGFKLPDADPNNLNATIAQNNRFLVFQNILWHFYQTPYLNSIETRTFDGMTWSTGPVIRSPTGRIMLQDIVIFKDRFVISWSGISSDWSGSHVYLTELTGDGAQISRIVNTDPDESTGSRLCVFNEQIYVVWLNIKRGEYGKYLSSRILISRFNGNGLSSSSSPFIVANAYGKSSLEVQNIFSFKGDLNIIWQKENEDRRPPDLYFQSYSTGLT